MGSRNRPRELPGANSNTKRHTMEFRNALRSTEHSSARKLFLRLARLGLLVLPVTLLIIVTLRVPVASKWALWMGILFQALAVLLLVTRAVGGEPTTAALILLHLTALVWLLLSTSGLQDWLIPLAESILVVVPLACFAIQCLRDSGAPTLRRARQLARQLARRTNWPVNRGDCRQLPEVRALREALHVDASPALGLLNHPRIEVRIAALTALEFRQNWRPGQPEMILQLAQRSPEPETRAAAVNALANVEDRRLIEALVATAEVVQRRLGIDMGLPRNQPVPAVHTRLAADVARRVMFWATQQHEAPAHEPAASSEAA